MAQSVVLEARKLYSHSLNRTHSSSWRRRPPWLAVTLSRSSSPPKLTRVIVCGKRPAGKRSSPQPLQPVRAPPLTSESVTAPPVVTPEPADSSLSRNSNGPALTKASNGSTLSQDSSDIALAKESNGSATSRTSTPNNFPSPLRIVWRQTVKQLSNLKLAIAELILIAALSALGTVIEQGQKVAYYAERYPESRPEFGFFTWKWIVNLQLDHIYSSGYFLGLLVLLAASLAACTSTTQWPMVKVAKRWSFRDSASQYKNLELKEVLDRARVTDLAALMTAKGYEVFVKDNLLYGFKGLVGKLGPIGVHASLLLILGGAAYSALGGFVGSTMTPEGQEFYVADALTPVGPLSSVPRAAQELRLHVNEFTIAYRENGDVEQFYSDLSLLDLNDREVDRKVISVNTPLRYGGFTMYQTDWAISAMQLRVDGNSIRLPMANLPVEERSGKLFGTFLRTGDGETPRGVSLITKDFQSVVLYGPDGKFVGVRRPGSNKPITIDGKEIVVEDLIGATGMELKVDPGVPFVYAGFAGLLVTVFVSFISHSQVWALEDGTLLYVGGRSSKNRVGFASEMEEVFNTLPEYILEGEQLDSGKRTAQPSVVS